MRIPWQWYPELEAIWNTAGTGTFTMTLVGFQSPMTLVRLENWGLVKRVDRMPCRATIWQLTSIGATACSQKFGPESEKTKHKAQRVMVEMIEYEISIKGRRRMLV